MWWRAEATEAAAIQDGWTVTQKVAEEVPGEMVQRPLEAGLIKEATPADGYTAIMLAAKYGHSEIVQQLLEAGANQEAALVEG